ncbi:putative efflux protein, MATE family [Lachnospiraceae bacterium NK3A20]|nr:putative efflux protein, MATE family [Lachnospiraceae bacterium NK3A20]
MVMGVQAYRQLHQDSVSRQFARYVLQSIAGMIGISAYVLADTYFISVAEGADGIAALNLVLPVYSVIYAIGAMIGVGSATKFAILRAQGSRAAALYFSNAIYWLCLLSLPFMASGVFLPGQIMTALGGTGRIVTVGVPYTRIFLLFTPLFMCNYAFTAFVRNDGDPRVPMVATIASSLFNIAGDWFLMFPLRLGITGAALATALSPLVSILICLVHFRKPSNTLRLVRTKPFLAILRDSSRLGVSALVGELAGGITTLVFNFVILRLAGSVGIAAYAVVANTAIVAVSVFNGIAEGSQPLISEYHGQGERHSEHRVLRLALLSSLAAAACILLITNLVPEEIVAVFNREENRQMAALAVPGVRIYFIGYLFAGCNIVMAAYFAASNRAGRAFLVSILRGVVMTVIFALTLPAAFGMNGVWLAFPAAELVTMLVAILCLVSQQQGSNKTASHAGDPLPGGRAQHPRTDHSLGRKRLLGICIMVCAIALITLLCWILVRPMLSLVHQPEALRGYVAERELPGVLLFMAALVLQVFAAVIPGGPFEIAAGYAFGVIRGSIICDIAMTFGSVMVFLLSRKFGMRFVELFFSKKQIESVKFLHTNEKEDNIIFLLFLVPGTPKDLISYLVGLTDLPLARWIFIVSVGRFPSILLSALSGQALGAAKYEIFLLALLVIGALYLVGMLIYRKRNR